MSNYRQDVEEMAASILEECREEYNNGTKGEPLREWLLDHIHESIDGCARVIYTAQAKECVCESDNDGAYAENFGPEGMVTDGCINWSALAYAAFEADVIEELTNRLDFDVNDPTAFFEAEKDEAADEEATATEPTK